MAAAYPSTARRNVGIREIALCIRKRMRGQPWRSDTLDVNASGTGADIKPDQTDLALIDLSVDSPALDVNQIPRL